MRSFPGTSSEDFERFKRDFRTSAYTCRFNGCTRATIGFGDDQARTEHEKSHTQILRCTFPGCRYDLPFRSTNALRSHMTKYHAPPKAKTGPRTLRKSKARAKLRADPSEAGEAYSNRLATDEPYTSTKPVLCTVWEKCMSEVAGEGLEWIETGEGWCTAFATVVCA